MASTRKVFSLKLQDGETARYTAVIRDENGAVIDITLQASLTSMVFSLYNKATGVHVGARSSQNVLGTPSMGVYPGAFNHTLNANGTLTYKLTTGDTSGPTTTAITYVGRYVYVFPDADTVSRTGVHEFEYVVEPLDTVT